MTVRYQCPCVCRNAKRSTPSVFGGSEAKHVNLISTGLGGHVAVQSFRQPSGRYPNIPSSRKSNMLQESPVPDFGSSREGWAPPSQGVEKNKMQPDKAFVAKKNPEAAASQHRINACEARLCGGGGCENQGTDAVAGRLEPSPRMISSSEPVNKAWRDSHRTTSTMRSYKGGRGRSVGPRNLSRRSVPLRGNPAASQVA